LPSTIAHGFAAAVLPEEEPTQRRVFVQLTSVPAGLQRIARGICQLGRQEWILKGVLEQGHGQALQLWQAGIDQDQAVTVEEVQHQAGKPLAKRRADLGRFQEQRLDTLDKPLPL
jgi:hypothetical protein